MRKEIEEERNQMMLLCDAMRKEYRKELPGIKTTRSHGTCQYRVKGQYFSKKKVEEIKNLVQNEYYGRMIPHLELVVGKLDELLALMDENKLDQTYARMGKEKQKYLENALYLPTEVRARQFGEEKIEGEAVHHEITTEIYTIKGEQVRSKSEKIIADELYRREIPYHYERPLEVISFGKEIVLHPDFTVMNRRTGDVFLLEHLGMMDDSDYQKNSFQKLTIYEKNGYLLGKNLLLLHETREEPLNVKILNRYIEEYLI